jgi:hypothetical protein
MQAHSVLLCKPALPHLQGPSHDMRPFGVPGRTYGGQGMIRYVECRVAVHQQQYRIAIRQSPAQLVCQSLQRQLIK